MARNYHQGKYTLLNPDKYVGNKKDIVFRSSWELKFMRWCDTNPSILKWNSEEMVVKYVSPIDNQVHRYFVDAVIQYLTPSGEKRTAMIEIKPEAQTKQPVPGKRKTKSYMEACETWIKNKAKWKAATEYAKKRGMEFLVLTERHLGI